MVDLSKLFRIDINESSLFSDQPKLDAQGRPTAAMTMEEWYAWDLQRVASGQARPVNWVCHHSQGRYDANKNYRYQPSRMSGISGHKGVPPAGNKAWKTGFRGRGL